jgi:hypothetical protein
VVELGHTFMGTNFGGRERPELVVRQRIIKWVEHLPLAQCSDCGVNLVQRGRARVGVDGAPVFGSDGSDQVPRRTKIFKLRHQPLEHSAMHAGERLLDLPAVPAAPVAEQPSAVGARLIML